MENTEEVSALELKNISLTKYDYGYWIIVFFSVVMLFFIVAQLFSIIEKDEITLVGNSLKTIIGIIGIMMSYSVTKSLDGNLKRTWKILTWAYIFNTGGDTIWYYYASVLDIKPFPSWADVSFLLHYPVMLWALLSYPTESKVFDKKQLIADISIVMVSGTTLVWYFIIHPTLSGITEEDLISPALNLSYTVGDMVLLLGILIVFFRGVEENLKRAFQLIAGGVICMLIADLGFAYLTLQGSYFGGHWIENFFIFNSLSHIYAAYYQYNKSLKETENEEDVEVKINVTESSALNWFPYIAILLGVMLLAWEAMPYWGETLGKVVLSSIALTILVVFRQFIAVKENIKLLAEKAKQQSELRFRTLIQNSSDIITIRDFNGNLLYKSPSMERILGYEQDELTIENNKDLFHPDDKKELNKTFEIYRTDDTAVLKREYRLRHKDGSWRIFEGVGKVVKDEAEGINGVIFNSRDITERKVAENQLRAYTNKLQLSNRELQDFAFVASHDLQEPLRKVQAFGDRLRTKHGESLNEEGKDYLERMQNAAKRMQTLINDLLSFSRVTTKAQPFRAVDLTKIAKEVISDLEVKIEETEATVIVENLPFIEADATQMRQLLQNLIGNSLKFRQADVKPIIKVYGFQQQQSADAIHQTIIDDESKDLWTIIVEDNGIGFEQKYLDRIFTVFQRLHGRTQYEGSGIGLAVCRKIVERHGGQITAESTPDNGAKFIITIPTKQLSQGENTDAIETLINNITG